MTEDEIQAYRKRRLKELILKHFNGANIQLSRLLKNKKGECFKDGAYVGHMLIPHGEPHSRPITESRVREIEALKSEFAGWFNLPSIPRRHGGVLHGTITVPNQSPLRATHDQGVVEPLTQPGTLQNLQSGDTPTGRAPVIAWARMGSELYKDKEELGVGESLPVGEEASSKAKFVIVESDCPRFWIKRGWAILVEPVSDPSACVSGSLHVFREEDGRHFLAEFRRLASGGYEAIPDYGPPLDSDRHRIVVVARWVATHSR